MVVDRIVIVRIIGMFFDSIVLIVILLRFGWLNICLVIIVLFSKLLMS